MRHGQTMRNYAKAFFAFAALATVGACADNNSVAPSSAAPVVTAPANYSKVGNSVVFRVNNNQGITQKIGNHLISFPAGAICDLEKSGYGPTTWNQPCKPQKGSVVITATVFMGPNGEPYIDFQPAMRFSPDKEVMLFFREGRSNGQMLTIRYCNALAVCTDESLTDPSLKPFRVGRTSIIGRRVKHFTGYNVLYEGDCPGIVTPIGDGSFYCDLGDSMTRRSGYMVASGEDVSDVMKGDDKKDKDKDSQ